MVSHWTKRFDKATASLREGGYFEGKQPLEELLPPDDWRLKEILKYREQSVIYEELANMRAKAQIRKLLDKHGITSPVSASILLRKCGMAEGDIRQITGIKRSAFFANVTRVVRRGHGTASLLPKEAVAIVRYKLEGGKHSEEA